MVINDTTGRLLQSDINEIENFITSIRSEAIDRFWLKKITIKDIQHATYLGKWSVLIKKDAHGKISGIAAEIILNSYYLTDLEMMKEVLSHEYGHHWTITHFSTNPKHGGFELSADKIPNQYYNLRLLNPLYHPIDYSMGWAMCDREIIAEDYRVLFTPYNTDHAMSNIQVIGDVILHANKSLVEDYLRDLHL